MHNLLIILPVALLLLAALGIVILQQLRPSIGYAWLIAMMGALATSVALLVLRWQIPLHLDIAWWRPFADLSSPPSFLLDQHSWPYAFSLGLVALAFLLTDAARLETEARPYNWAVGLGLTGLGLLAVTASNPITLVAIWTAVDFSEFLMLITTPVARRMGTQTITFFAVRVAGTLLVIVAILFARSQGIPFILDTIPAGLAFLMLLAVGLRLGVLPLNIPYTRELYPWHGLGNVMRMIGPASSLMVLGRMPEQALPSEWRGFMLLLSALAALYGGAMWLTVSHERNGRPFWFAALSAFAVASVVNGHPLASIAWGMVLILPGSLLFFYSVRRRQILFIPLLGALGIVGLPYNPAAPGWVGVTGPGSGMFGVLFLLAALFLVLGYLKHVLLRPRDELYRLERWVHTVYPAGLLFLVLGQWVIAVFGWPGSLSIGTWWASMVVTFLAALSVMLALMFRQYWYSPSSDATSRNAEVSPAALSNSTDVPGSAAAEMPVNVPGEESAALQRWVLVFSRQVGGVLAAIFRLNWLYRMIAWLYRVAQNIIQLLTAIFEGDGGILWSLVMLALLISIILAGGQQ